MPYIESIKRQELMNWSTPDVSGELTYVLTSIVIEYLVNRGLTYQTCNDIVGALDNCKDEFRRRVQHPYEDKKIRENGDCYPEQFVKRIQE